MVYKRTITRFMADDKVVYQRDGRRDWLPIPAEHDVVWSIWARDWGELSCAHFDGECQFHAKSDELIGAFLVCPPDWASFSTSSMSLSLCAKNLPLPGSRAIVPVLHILFSRQSMLSNSKTLSGNSTAFMHLTPLTDEDFWSESHLPM